MRKLALFLLPVALLAMACNSDSGSKTNTPKKTSTAGTPTIARTAAATSTFVSTPAGENASATPPASASDADPFSMLFGDVSPFSFLDSASSIDTKPADPELKADLLRESDLPSGFSRMEEFGTTLPTEFGSAEMAANMFANGDPESMSGTMVLSASIKMPQEALDEFERQGGFDHVQDLTSADLQDIEGATAALGISMTDVRLLDARGLGDGGFGMHMVMDFSGLAEAFGAPDSGDESMPSAIVMDLYLFQKGDHMLITMVMAADDSTGVDSRALAEAMDR